MKPRLGACNEKELVFDLMDSSYQVRTAGSKGTGRSATAQLFHGSEVAFWPDAAEHLSGIGQIVARIPGTEIIYESTADGVGNEFHSLWQQAERGEGDLEAIFIPWFWEPGYATSVPHGFTLDEEERVYQETHKLTLDQMAWRRAKIQTDFRGDAARFAQEYPATPAEAFTAVGHDPLIKPALVMQAVGRKVGVPSQRLIVGVDPARFGDNATTIARRRGRTLFPVERIHKQDTMATVGRLVVLIRDEKPVKLFIDLGGLGAGIYDRLVELGYGNVVVPINFGDTANRVDRYYNRRSEMWCEIRDWLPLASIPNDSVLIGDLSGPKYKYDSDGRVKLESKEDMRARNVKSPDCGDALGLTFAIPVESLAASDPLSAGAQSDYEEEFRTPGEHDESSMFGIRTG